MPAYIGVRVQGTARVHCDQDGLAKQVDDREPSRAQSPGVIRQTEVVQPAGAGPLAEQNQLTLDGIGRRVDVVLSRECRLESAVGLGLRHPFLLLSTCQPARRTDS